MKLFVLLVVVLKLVSRGKCNAQCTLVNLVLLNLAIKSCYYTHKIILQYYVFSFAGYSLMCIKGYNLHNVTYEGCNIHDALEKANANDTCNETCYTLDLWVAGGNDNHEKKPITLMGCGGKGSLSHVEESDLTCNPVCSTKVLEGYEPHLEKFCNKFKEGNDSTSPTCCNIIENLQAATWGYCKKDFCNDKLYCPDRHLPTDQVCVNKLSKNQTTTAVSVTEGNVITDIGTEGITHGTRHRTHRQGTRTTRVLSGGNTNIMKLVDIFDLPSAILFQMLILTFVWINSLA